MARSPSAIRSRSVASDSGPRLMTSPANQSGVAALGAALDSSRWNASRQPWMSPNARGGEYCAGESSISEAIGYKIYEGVLGDADVWVFAMSVSHPSVVTHCGRGGVTSE